MYSKAVNLICKFEGFSSFAYKCPAGVWTIGYGRTAGVREGMTISEPEARKYVEQQCEKIGQSIQGLLKVTVTENQLSALISFYYNIGCSAFMKSTLLRKLNAGDIEGAANEFPKWNKAGGRVLAGLVRRREAERQLFLEV